MTKCYYPTYENEDALEFITATNHKWGKDGFCIVCGEYDAERRMEQAERLNDAEMYRQMETKLDQGYTWD